MRTIGYEAMGIDMPAVCDTEWWLAIDWLAMKCQEQPETNPSMPCFEPITFNESNNTCQKYDLNLKYAGFSLWNLRGELKNL